MDYYGILVILKCFFITLRCLERRLLNRARRITKQTEVKAKRPYIRAD